MKNSTAIMQKYTKPIAISPMESLVIEKAVWTLDIPLSKNATKNAVPNIAKGLNFASHATIIAVNPRFLADSAVMV